jgi:hypothetical protein
MSEWRRAAALDHAVPLGGYKQSGWGHEFWAQL